MIPDNPNLYNDAKLSSRFQFPDSVSGSELEDWERGGLAIQDPSKGLNYQNWYGYWNPTDTTAYLVPDSTGIPQAIFVESNVVEFSFTFDQNMRWVSATRSASDALSFRWYDTALEAYTTTSYAEIASVRVTHDDKRDLQITQGVSDVILTYIRAGLVRWRVQRDRYLTEYSYSELPVPNNHRITNFGMNAKNRLQWRIGPRRINL